MTTFERFLGRVETSSTGCWLWIGGKDGDGYGMFWLDGRNQRAHRVSYELFIAPIPAGLHGLHRCDVPSCVNPLHVFIGTNLDNVRDSFTKGRAYRRSVPRRGEQHPNAKLTEAVVLEVRAIPKGGRVIDIARRAGVSVGTLHNLRKGKGWQHLEAR